MQGSLLHAGGNRLLIDQTNIHNVASLQHMGQAVDQVRAY